MEGIVTPFGPDHFETQCGIKVRGTRIIDYSAHGADYELLGSGGEILRVNLLDRPAASVILRFDGDFGTVLPVIRGFVTAVTVIGEELVDVAYEPWFTRTAGTNTLIALRKYGGQCCGRCCYSAEPFPN